MILKLCQVDQCPVRNPVPQKVCPNLQSSPLLLEQELSDLALLLPWEVVLQPQDKDGDSDRFGWADSSCSGMVLMRSWVSGERRLVDKQSLQLSLSATQCMELMACTTRNIEYF